MAGNGVELTSCASHSRKKIIGEIIAANAINKAVNNSPQKTTSFSSFGAVIVD
jgi:hypothetical protein